MRNRSLITTLAVAASLAAIPASAGAQAVGSGGTGHQGCYSQEGIPIDHGQSVILGDTTISCNNGTVCVIRKAAAFCYFAPDSSNPGMISVPPKPKGPVVVTGPIRPGTLLLSR